MTLYLQGSGAGIYRGPARARCFQKISLPSVGIPLGTVIPAEQSRNPSQRGGGRELRRGSHEGLAAPGPEATRVMTVLTQRSLPPSAPLGGAEPGLRRHRIGNIGPTAVPGRTPRGQDKQACCWVSLGLLCLPQTPGPLWRPGALTALPPLPICLLEPRARATSALSNLPSDAGTQPPCWVPSYDGF